MFEAFYTGWFEVAESHDVTENTNFADLLSLIETDIKALEIDGTKVFKQVGCFVQEPVGVKVPMCAIRPVIDPIELNGIGSLCEFTDYQFSIGIGVKGIKDTKIIADVLKCRSAVKKYFQKTKKRYTEVSGHINISVEVGEVDLIEDWKGVLLFESGLKIICKVQE
jgi:hypothetical protein